jgi:hypothetical protein
VTDTLSERSESKCAQLNAEAADLKAKLDKRVYDLRISIAHIEPEIWRTIAISADMKLPELHLSIQGVFAWENIHMHRFDIAGKRYEGAIGSRTALRSVLSEGLSFEYTYDFGDWWLHRIEVVRSYEVPNRRNYPKVLGGAGVAPHEDSGGFPAYQALGRLPGAAAELTEHQINTARWRMERFLYE